ncbi:unnamed protein product [Schistosoma curassoni]|uniref:Secreted protein n=1 Tax=Schistosoma curassoni TaxID=6186 RepID=A0A183KDD7_9TREM|nr:unnamed protein product [Schistosoma curassoni]
MMMIISTASCSRSCSRCTGSSSSGTTTTTTNINWTIFCSICIMHRYCSISGINRID